jgi:nucleoside-diphosphate-sugar epimerase
VKVFLAGGTGAIGVPLVRALVARGHQVIATTRSPQKQHGLQAIGATPVIADALDRDALVGVVGRARPDAVVHELTALPKGGPRRASDLDATNRLRIEGTRNLLDAAIEAGVRRFLVGSFAPLSPRDPVDTTPADAATAAVWSMERQVLDATKRGAIEGIVLRYGMFYGLETPSTMAMLELVRKRRLPVVRGDEGQLPIVHIEDAASATVRALEVAPAGAVYDIVDDRPVSLTEIVEGLATYTGAPKPFRVPRWLPRLLAPYLAKMMSLRMPLSNASAKAALGWHPRYPTLQDGLSEMFQHAA